MACKPGSVRRHFATAIWQPFLWEASYLAPHATHPAREPETAHMRALFGLAPGGVYHAAHVSARAVGSYPTLSPLPLTVARGGLLSVALSLGSRRAEVIRRLVSMEPGLSSSTRLPSHQRLPGHLVRIAYSGALRWRQSARSDGSEGCAW